MDWSALAGGFIGAGIPAVLAYLGLSRVRQSADAEAFGPAVLLLDRVNPERVTINFNPDAPAEAEKWEELQRQLDTARERLLVVSAGNPRRRVRELARVAEAKVYSAFTGSSWAVRDMQANRDNPEWLNEARKRHAGAEAAMRELIDANFSWPVFQRHRPTARHSVTGPDAKQLKERSAHQLAPLKRSRPRQHDVQRQQDPPRSRHAGAGGVQ